MGGRLSGGDFYDLSADLHPCPRVCHEVVEPTRVMRRTVTLGVTLSVVLPIELPAFLDSRSATDSGGSPSEAVAGEHIAILTVS